MDQCWEDLEQTSEVTLNDAFDVTTNTSLIASLPLPNRKYFRENPKTPQRDIINLLPDPMNSQKTINYNETTT